jgi:hypothetical protein
MATLIRTNMITNKAYDLNKMFSPTQSSLHLGEDFFFKIKQQMPQAQFRSMYERTMYSYLTELDQNNLQLLLCDRR